MPKEEPMTSPIIQIIIVKKTATPPVAISVAVNIFVFAMAIFAVLSTAAEPPFINSTTFSFNIIKTM